MNLLIGSEPPVLHSSWRKAENICRKKFELTSKTLYIALYYPGTPTWSIFGNEKSIPMYSLNASISNSPASKARSVVLIAVDLANIRWGIGLGGVLVTCGKFDTWNATRYVGIIGLVSNSVVTDPSGLNYQLRFEIIFSFANAPQDSQKNVTYFDVWDATGMFEIVW